MNKYGYFKVAAAVPSVRVADCQYNAEHIVAMMRRAADRGVRVVVFPELSITGASCGDLLRQPMLLSAAEQALEGIARASGELGIAAIVGLPVAAGERLFNCAAVVAD
ncbi:MAG: NAD(+) synthase, partial [Alistipes sp.]|nr:NAD(+) synthase [Alistipes sp.]